MIHYSLMCDQRHTFDAWFSSSADFEKQQNRALVECPHCGSRTVRKSLMTPGIAASDKAGSSNTTVVEDHHRSMMDKLKAIRDVIVERSDNVGEAFPEEARKIHYGEADARPILGEASHEQAKSLLEEGIGVLPLPQLPEDRN